jgi:hypothetical protein
MVQVLSQTREGHPLLNNYKFVSFLGVMIIEMRLLTVGVPKEMFLEIIKALNGDLFKCLQCIVDQKSSPLVPFGILDTNFTTH